jgi:hypothetical protein
VAGNCALHSHMMRYFSTEAQQAVFGNGPSVPFIGTGFNGSAA